MDRTKYMSREEMMQLRASVELRAHQSGRASDRLTWLCVDMALQTGLRVNELAKIELDDIDLERSFMFVNRSKKRQPLREIIPIPPSLHSHLAHHLEWLEAHHRIHFWAGERGPWTTRGLQQAWDRACRRAGVRGYSIHAARHTLATHLLRQSNNLRMVQKQLGHSSPTTTANMYADVPFEDQLEMLKGVFERSQRCPE